MDPESANNDHIFISYTYSDKEIVHKVVDRLLAAQHKIWIDRTEFQYGEILSERMEQGIIDSSFILYFISKNYVISANRRLEFFYAHSLNKKCLYIVLEKFDKKEANGMTIYLYGEEIRFDAHKFFKNDVDEYAKEICLKIESTLRRLRRKKKNTLFNSQDSIVKEDDDDIFQQRDDFFIGRADTLALMDREDNKRIVILSGLPGVGKTSVATEYMYRKLEDGRQVVKKVYWFNAEFDYKINNLLYEYGTKLQSHKSSDGYSETINKFVQSIENSRDVLLVFDNVEDLQVLKKAIDIDRIKCRVLITTRNERVFSIHATKINILPFDIHETEEYIKQRVPHLQAEEINAICMKLTIENQSLPYNVVMITAILNDDQTSNVTTFLETLDYGEQDTYMQSILDNMKKKSTEAVQLLKNIMSIDPDYIPGKLIERILDGNKYKEAIQALINQNLCKIVFPNTRSYGISIHRLLQTNLEACIKTDASHEEQNQIILNLMSILNEEFPEVDDAPGEKWKQADIYYKHLKRLEHMMNEDNEVASKLLYKLSLYNRHLLINFKEALELAKKSLSIAMRRKYEDKQIAPILSLIGLTYRAVGNNKEELDYLMQTLDIYKRMYTSRDDPQLATSYNNVGNTFSDLGNNEKALEYLMQALEIRKRIFEGDHADLAMSYNNIGLTYSDLGNYEKALEFQLLALDIRKRLYEEDHPHIAMSYNNIGLAYFDLGDNEKTLEYELKALDIRKRIYEGLDHPILALSFNNIGLSYSDLGNHEKALEFETNALDMYKRIYMESDHSDLARSFSNVGQTYFTLGDNQTALEYQVQALDMYKRLFEGDHPDVALSYNDVGMTYSALGDYGKALEYCRLAWEMRKRVLPIDHRDIKKSETNMSLLLSKLDKSRSDCSNT